jgi:hypothetical protein
VLTTNWEGRQLCARTRSVTFWRKVTSKGRQRVTGLLRVRCDHLVLRSQRKSMRDETTRFWLGDAARLYSRRRRGDSRCFRANRF